MNKILKLRFINLFLIGIASGWFVISNLTLKPAFEELDGPTYAIVKSANDATLGPIMPFLFIAIVALTLAVLVMTRNRRDDLFKLTLWILLLWVFVVVVTVTVNLPINGQTIQWPKIGVPPDWQEIRDRWELANLVRGVAVTTSFILQILVIAKLIPKKLS